MIYYRCLILGNKGKRLNQIEKILKNNGYEVVKAYNILEFIKLNNSFHQNCMIIDYDPLKNNLIVNTIVNTDKKFLKNALLISEKEIDGCNTVTLNDLAKVVKLKKENIVKEQLTTITGSDYAKTYSATSKFLIANGLDPKYNGFAFLTDFLTLFKLHHKQGSDIHKMILQSLAYKHNTSTRNISQSIREVLKHSTSDNLITSYANPNLKQIIQHIHTKLLLNT